MLHRFPYTNFHDLNADWILEQLKTFQQNVKDLYDMFENDVQTKTQQYINDHLAQFLLGAMYDEPNTAIKLQPVEVLVDSDHVYYPNSEEIRVLENNDIRMEVR